MKFYADWCGPCKALAPILEKVTSEAGVQLVSVDVDKHPDVAAMYAVKSIPAIFVIKDGKPIDQAIGGMSEQKVRIMVSKLLPENPN